jgi:alcohol dehydrogenase
VASLSQFFDFQLRTRVVFGPNTVDQLGALTVEYGGRRVLVVSDPGVVAAGHADRAVRSLRQAGLDAFLYDGVHENPTTRDVDLALAFARQHRVDFLVGLGGGSSMDCAKGVNFLLTNGGRMSDYWGVGKAAKPMLPMIAVPTTGGTGSEAQSFALIGDDKTHQKMACGDKKAACRAAILDPTLTVTQPPRVTAVTGIDAISHALETWVTNVRNPVSQMFSMQAWRMMVENFPRVMAEPTNLEARAAMLLGSHLAGAAIECSMLGAAHSLANPLTARYNIVHGAAIGLMLPHVVRFNAAATGALYAELPTGNGQPTAQTAGEALGGLIESFCKAAGLPMRLSECGVDRETLPTMAAEAARQWTAQYNPRPVGKDELLELYQCAF